MSACKHCGTGIPEGRKNCSDCLDYYFAVSIATGILDENLIEGDSERAAFGAEIMREYFKRNRTSDL